MFAFVHRLPSCASGAPEGPSVGPQSGTGFALTTPFIRNDAAVTVPANGHLGAGGSREHKHFRRRPSVVTTLIIHVSSSGSVGLDPHYLSSSGGVGPRPVSSITKIKITVRVRRVPHRLVWDTPTSSFRIIIVMFIPERWMRAVRCIFTYIYIYI